jgi:hypothetical protein
MLIRGDDKSIGENVQKSIIPTLRFVASYSTALE